MENNTSNTEKMLLKACLTAAIHLDHQLEEDGFFHVAEWQKCPLCVVEAALAAAGIDVAEATIEDLQARIDQLG